jgi:4-hydroxy-2-oxoheptanedioate aldolase
MTSVRARLSRGDQLLGTFVQLRDPASCERAARCGLDVLVMEGEHSGMGVETIQQLVAATQLTAARALVRVAGNDPVLIAAALDAGADGIIVPRVNTVAEARDAVDAARYPPVGHRGLGPSRATAYGDDIFGYLVRANDELLVAIQVETREALENLDELLGVPGVDLFFVGPGDLAVSLGIEDPASPELRNAIESVLAGAREAGRLAGVFAATPVDAARWREAGVELVVLGSDLTWLAAGLGAAVVESRA